MRVMAMAFLLALGAVPALASPGDLAARLHHGGYVLVMRHAHAPDQPPAPGDVDAGNPSRERQLDQEGRDQAKAVGQALRRLQVPVGLVFSSPTYRAMETARLLDVGKARPVPQLGDQGHSMQRITGLAPTAWLQQTAAGMPPAGRNVLIVTQMPNIAAAFPQDAKSLHDGEVLVFKPDGHGGAALVARVTPGDWAGMTR